MESSERINNHIIFSLITHIHISSLTNEWQLTLQEAQKGNFYWISCGRNKSWSGPCTQWYLPGKVRLVWASRNELGGTSGMWHSIGLLTSATASDDFCPQEQHTMFLRLFIYFFDINVTPYLGYECTYLLQKLLIHLSFIYIREDT